MAIPTTTMVGLKNPSRTIGMLSSLKLCRGAQIFEKYRDNFKILGARKVTGSKLHIQHTNIQYLAAQTTWLLG